MRTQLLGTLTVDDDRLRRDLAVAETFTYSDAYSDYVCGGLWRSCMLWSVGGEPGDGVITEYDHDRPSAVTPFGEQVPYLRSLIEQTFDLAHLNFVRLAVIANSVVIPHRDLLDLGEIPTTRRNTHRIHVPLVTNEQCFFAEDDLVFRMKANEVWALDASREHSAASFSTVDRIHLMADFCAVDQPRSLVKLPPAGVGIPPSSICHREALKDEVRDALLDLAAVIDSDNYKDVFAIVIKAHYRYDGGAGFVWETLSEIARRSEAPDVMEKVSTLHQHFLITGSDQKVGR